MSDHVLAIDQGTTSTRAIVFDAQGGIVAVAQREHEQIFPRGRLGRARPDRDLDQHAVGHRGGARRGGAGSRATSPRSGSRTSARPRSSGTAAPAGRSPTPSSGRTPAPSRSSTGSPPTAAPTVSPRRPACRWRPTSRHPRSRWILDNVPGARADAEAGHLLFGTPDTWLIWNLTGDARGGIHVTDVTNASRTLLMDLATLDWSDELLEVFGIPRSMLPEIVSSSDVVGEVQSRRRRARHPHRGNPRRPAGGDLRAGGVRSRASRRTPTARATSCWSTPEPRSCAPSTGWSRRWRTGAATSPRTTRWRARSR